MLIFKTKTMEQKKSFNNIVYMFAALYGIAGILFMLIKSPTADPREPNMIILGYVSLFLFISLPVLAILYYKKQGYPVTLGKAVKLGVLVGLLGGLIIGVYTYIYFSYINPDAVDQVLEMNQKVLEDMGDFLPPMDEEQIEMSKKFFLPGQIFGQIFWGLVFGVVGGLLGGLFFKTPTEDY